ncbi:hypothetical protein MRB53_006517 [Persea americana]|uniref:Uncharacterized protein n=1 Tax=Persea americana TaxID=3435 RepID=A0ACC2MGD1_PERAE|nr:hypothetical protein MRB53_006517 [Persea americana]
MEVPNCPESDPKSAAKKRRRSVFPPPSGDHIVGTKSTAIGEGSKQKVGKATTPIGRQVTGVVDGMFDMGFLVSVQIGESDAIYPGVVFGPGLIIPPSKTNDIAPNVGYTARKLDVKGHKTM